MTCNENQKNALVLGLAHADKVIEFNTSLVERIFKNEPAEVGCYFRLEVWDGDQVYAWSNPFELS